MSHPLTPPDCSVAPAQVWGTLAIDCKTRIVWLLAQLAFNLVMAQADRHAQEVPYVALSSRPAENPA
jgi:hypothetical protein